MYSGDEERKEREKDFILDTPKEMSNQRIIIAINTAFGHLDEKLLLIAIVLLLIKVVMYTHYIMSLFPIN